MKFCLIFIFLISLTQGAYAISSRTKANIETLITKSLWSVDSLDFATSQKKNLSICYSLGEIAFSIKLLSLKSIKTNKSNRDFINDKSIVNLIRNFPFIPSVCSGGKKMGIKERKKVRKFSVKLRLKLEKIQLQLKK